MADLHWADVPSRTSCSSSRVACRLGHLAPHRRNYVKRIVADKFAYRGEGGVHMLHSFHNCQNRALVKGRSGVGWLMN